MTIKYKEISFQSNQQQCAQGMAAIDGPTTGTFTYTPKPGASGANTCTTKDRRC